jgi:hypothetical protein
VRSARWRAAESHSSGQAVPGATVLRESRAPPCHAPSSPLLSFLAPASVPLPSGPGRKKASHKLISTPLHCPCAALCSGLALPDSWKSRSVLYGAEGSCKVRDSTKIMRQN